MCVRIVCGMVNLTSSWLIPAFTMITYIFFCSLPNHHHGCVYVYASFILSLFRFLLIFFCIFGICFEHKIVSDTSQKFSRFDIETIALENGCWILAHATKHTKGMRNTHYIHLHTPKNIATFHRMLSQKFLQDSQV